jgi:thiamine pyrophosphate-dependent acetolactate synthase large subunit-like protein
MATGAQKVAETLIDAGIDHIFGIPGLSTTNVRLAEHCSRLCCARVESFLPVRRIWLCW